MLYHIPHRTHPYPVYDHSDKEMLMSRPPYITITNVCNLHCGGCSQLCGHFEKEQLWFMTVDEIRAAIEVMGKYVGKTIWIFGGEPTIHPQFEEIKDLLYSYNGRYSFIIFTNGRLHPNHPTEIDDDHPDRQGGWVPDKLNVKYLIDFKQRYGKDGVLDKDFNPTLVAPMDVLKVKSKKYYWEEARRHCICWNKCGTTIYNNRAYICEVAGAFDAITGEDNGWPLVAGDNPFDKTDEEIAEQAEKFCYRCAAGYSNDKHIIPDQKISQKSFVSITNLVTKKTDKMQVVKSIKDVVSNG
jgi:hypothetical protein